MKHVILHYFFILYVCDIKLCTSSKRHRSRNGNYDINGFISQLLASSKFDELAEKLAEKAANRIMNMKEDQSPLDKIYDDKEIQDGTETATENSRIQLEEDYVKNQKRKGFAGKVDPLAVMNESISLSENLMLKYKLFKKNALDKKTNKLKESVPKNSTQEEHKGINSAELANDENTKKGAQTNNENITPRNIDDVERKDDDQKDEPKRYTEPNHFERGKDFERIERSHNNGHQPKEPSLGQEERELNLRVEPNSAGEDQEARQVDNGIKEDIASSLDEQNRNYSPSDEKNNADAEVERNYDEPQKRAIDESVEVGHAPYFRAVEDNVEENVVPSKSDKPIPDGVNDRNKRPNESAAAGNRGTNERFPEDMSSAETVKEDSVKPEIRKEGDKVYTYNQDPEYQEYHEEMAKWKQGHPNNPSDFL